MSINTTKGTQSVTSGMSENDALGKAHSSITDEDKTPSDVCPTCGDSFKSEQGVKQHHAKVHGESLATTTVECDNCGEDFEKNASTAERYDSHYCSEDCQYDGYSQTVTVECDWCSSDIERAPSQINERNFCDNACGGEWRSENTSGEQSWHWKGGDRELECDVCGDTFEVSPGRVDEARFCSETCHGEWLSTAILGEDHPRWIGGTVDVDCDYCGESVEKTQWRIDKYKHTFCGAECRHEWLSENRSGEDSYSYIGGAVNNYGVGWTEQREKALKRDGNQCQDCGVTQEETDFRLEVHHIRPMRTFEDKEKANRVENLITFCRACHVKWEGLWLKPSNGGE